MKAPTKTEKEILSLILREIRHVVATKEQLQIVVDPFVLGGGTHVHFGYNGAGSSWAFEGEILRRRSKRPTGRHRR